MRDRLKVIVFSSAIPQSNPKKIVPLTGNIEVEIKGLPVYQQW